MAELDLPRSAVLAAPAKINIFLRVLGKRADGFHEISTLMQPVSLYDEVTIEVSSGSGITLESTEGAPSGPENIAFRAASLFLEETGIDVRVSIKLRKNTPSGAGLGGGSSDAATVLMGLNDLLEAGLDDATLMELAARLGSDVPFFILRRPALATGRGEILDPVDLPAFDYVLVNPGVVVPTARVYSNLDLTKSLENSNLTVSVETLEGPENLVKILHNDLEGVTVSDHPVVNALKDRLIEAGALGSLMSGSGPTVFGVFSGRDAASAAFDALIRELDSTHSVFLVRGLTGKEARRA